MDENGYGSKNVDVKSNNLKLEEQLADQIYIDDVELSKPYNAQKPGESDGVNLLEIVSPGRDILEVIEPRKPGRPRRTGEKPRKLTIEIDQDVYKALMFYKIDQGIYVNGYIEGLLKANVPEKYFKLL